VSSREPQKHKRPVVTLEPSQESALTERTSSLGDRALSLFETLRVYDRLVQIGKGITKRLELVDRLLSGIEAQRDNAQPTAQVVLDPTSLRRGVRFSLSVASGQQDLVPRIKFFQDLRKGLLRDEKNSPDLCVQAARVVKIEIKKMLRELDQFTHAEYAGIYSLNTHREWRGFGALYAQAAGMIKGYTPLDTAVLRELSERVIKLSYAVEVDFDLICARAVSPSPGSAKGLDATLRTGWRLGLPAPKSALGVSMYEVDGVELKSFGVGREELSSPNYEDSYWREDDDEQPSSREEEARLGRALVATRQLNLSQGDKTESVDVELGRLEYHRFGDVIEIHSIHVDESVRDQALGTRLMTAFLANIAHQAPKCAIFVDVPILTVDGSDYRYPSMDRFLNSLGFRWVSGAAEGFARYLWERDFAAPLLAPSVT
jgi:hypothetical protein